ncbi:hypothetical protein [Nocardia gipuzkoensis]|uniref:hypothetical protein n=1 Tax=Nocardia gipuzkoensis TaxID=2749991 RepID=UPI0015EEBCB8|nr:hypothetical protein [Nocardia gipuzkoensis]
MGDYPHHNIGIGHVLNEEGVMEDLAARFDELGRLVPIPHPWDVTEYLERVAEYRGRPITLCPIDVGALSEMDAAPEVACGLPGKTTT